MCPFCNVVKVLCGNPDSFLVNNLQHDPENPVAFLQGFFLRVGLL